MPQRVTRMASLMPAYWVPCGFQLLVDWDAHDCTRPAVGRLSTPDYGQLNPAARLESRTVLLALGHALFLPGWEL